MGSLVPPASPTTTQDRWSLLLLLLLPAIAAVACRRRWKKVRGVQLLSPEVIRSSEVIQSSEMQPEAMEESNQHSFHTATIRPLDCQVELLEQQRAPGLNGLAQPGGQPDGADGALAAAPADCQLAHERTLHLIKGLAASALGTTQMLNDTCLAGSFASKSAEQRVRRLVHMHEQVLHDAIDTCVSQHVAESVMDGSFTSCKTNAEVGAVLRRTLLMEGCVVSLSSGAADCNELHLMTDSTVLHIVLREVASNAEKYREPSTPITASAHLESSGDGAVSQLQITIENQNRAGDPRLSAWECERVFDESFRGANATITSTGLGLNTAAKAVQAANGAIRMATRAGADGTSFTSVLISLPALAGTPTASNASTSSNPPDGWRSLASLASPAPCDDHDDSGGSKASGHEASGHEASGHEASGHEASGELDAAAHTEEAIDAFSRLKLRILIGDDVRLNQKVAALTMKAALPNARVHCVCDPHTLLSKVLLPADSKHAKPGMGQSSPSHKYDVLITDEDYVAVMTGTDVIAKIRQAECEAAEAGLSTIPLLIVSSTAGSDDPCEHARILASGANLVWGKPLPSTLQIRKQLATAFVRCGGILPI